MAKLHPKNYSLLVSNLEHTWILNQKFEIHLEKIDLFKPIEKLIIMKFFYYLEMKNK